MGMLDQVKQAMQMRKEAKRLQAEVEKISCSYNNGGISITARGDFSITQVKISDEALEEIKAGKPERFETMLKNVITAVLGQVKERSQQLMQQAMKEGNLPFGK